ncbi:sigma-54 dependent transcriptional regulator [bacterium]|nr:sigma-54 dependent transcriptional regulator [bacterium]
MTNIQKKEAILIVDDSVTTLEVIQRNLNNLGYKVLCVESVVGAIQILDKNSIDLVITDLKMPKMSGFDLLRHVRENFKNTEIMMITGYATIEGAVEAVKAGADEYLVKPFTDVELQAAVQRSLNKLHIRRAGQAKNHIIQSHTFGLIGNSTAMQKVFDSIIKTSSTNATVLITGESGTGKELIARAIHYKSKNASAPFVPINCGGIPEGLLESELFGYIKGAFTGAVETRAGFFQSADGGTIFLDEVSETSLSMQVKLLRVLQDKEVCMVGSNRPQKVNVRILTATNKDLIKLVEKGAFREDLFYRINVITLPIPPLREREDDILLLTNHFASKFSKEFGKEEPVFSDNALKVLKSYYWSGNVRELENLIQRLIVMIDGDYVDVPDLPSHMRYTIPRDLGLNRTLEEVENEHIRNVLNSVQGNKSRAAEILGITRKTLHSKLSKIKIKSS